VWGMPSQSTWLSWWSSTSFDKNMLLCLNSEAAYHHQLFVISNVNIVALSANTKFDFALMIWFLRSTFLTEVGFDFTWSLQTNVWILSWNT
jgi:hypothetical protein